MLVAKFKSNLGKSSHGGETLYGHIMDCVKVAHKVLTDKRFVPPDYPKQKRDCLLLGTFFHDIGKLDPDFQKMLEASRDGQPLPPKRVKHEASTLNFEKLLIEAQEEVKEHLRNELDYRITEPIDCEDLLAFAVTHHGLFYMSFEQREREIVKRIRREWNVFNYGEQRRITLVDLLFDYHPLGGLVMIADLLGTYGHEQQIANADELIDRASSLRELIDLLLSEKVVDRVEESIKNFDQRTYGLRETLTLLAGGIG